jgi:biotin carboxyl carrier protein
VRLRVRAGGRDFEVALERGRVVVDGQAYQARVEGQGEAFVVQLGRARHEVRLGERVEVDGVALDVEVEPLPAVTSKVVHHGLAGPVLPPLPGRVVAVKVRPGQKVQAGQCLVVLEAMKMQNEVPAPADGTVQEVRVREGQLVEARDVLVVLA